MVIISHTDIVYIENITVGIIGAGQAIVEDDNGKSESPVLC